jgi:hypothetical protein
MSKRNYNNRTPSPGSPKLPLPTQKSNQDETPSTSSVTPTSSYASVVSASLNNKPSNKPATAYRPPAGAGGKDFPRKLQKTQDNNTMEQDLPPISVQHNLSQEKTATHSVTNAQPQTNDHSGAKNNAQISNTTPSPIINLDDPSNTADPLITPASSRDSNISRHAGDTDDVNMDNEDIASTIIADNSYLKAACPVSDLILPNETKRVCLGRIADYCINRFDSFCNVIRLGNNKEGLIIIALKDNKDFEELTNSSHATLQIDENHDVSQFFKYDAKAILAEKKLCTIIVRDIPVFIDQNTLITKFKRFGIIDKIKLHTPHNSIYQIADITYNDPKVVENIDNTQWSVFVKGECVRIYPAFLTNEQRILRNQHTAILRGLPTGIKGIDLARIYSEVNASSIGFTRHIKSYDTKPWAYFTFRTEESKQAAMEILCSFNNKTLEWVDPSAAKKLCVRCSSLAHVTKDCDAFQARTRKPTPKAIQALYNRHHLVNTTLQRGRKLTLSQSSSSSSSVNRSSSRSRSRSINKRNISNSKKVSYVETLINGSSLNDSVHNPANNKEKQPATSNNRQDLDRSALNKLAELINNTVKQFNTLKNEFTDWKSQVNAMDLRLTAIEEHCNI